MYVINAVRLNSKYCKPSIHDIPQSQVHIVNTIYCVLRSQV